MKKLIPIILALGFIAFGVVNIGLWYDGIYSIHGLVLGFISFILAWFVFHFRRKK